MDWMKVKKLLKSKVFWFNLITNGIAIVDALTGKVIPTELSATIIMIGNVLLRFVTSKPLDQK